MLYLSATRDRSRSAQLRSLLDRGAPFIGFQDRPNAAIHHDGSVIDPKRALARFAHGCRRMRDEQERLAGPAEGRHGFPAFLLKAGVAYSQYLVDEENIRVGLYGDRKR